MWDGVWELLSEIGGKSVCEFKEDKETIMQPGFLSYFFILQLLKDQIGKLQEGMATEIIAREILDERKTKEIKLVENNIALELNVEKQSRKEIEQRITKKVEEKIYSLRVDVAKEQKANDELLERQTSEISDQIQTIQNDLENERRTR